MGVPPAHGRVRARYRMAGPGIGAIRRGEVLLDPSQRDVDRASLGGMARERVRAPWHHDVALLRRAILGEIREPAPELLMRQLVSVAIHKEHLASLAEVPVHGMQKRVLELGGIDAHHEAIERACYPVELGPDAFSTREGLAPPTQPEEPEREDNRARRATSDLATDGLTRSSGSLGDCGISKLPE